MIAFIYILENDASPGIHKVGFTTREVATRLAELNGQTGTIGRYKLVEFHEVPASLADAIEGLAHSYLSSAGKHYAKEYFKAAPEDCRSAILKAIDRTGAAEKLRKIKEKLQERDKAKAANAEANAHARHERTAALYRAFLLDTKPQRRALLEALEVFERHRAVESRRGLLSAIFGSESPEYAEAKKNLVKLFMTYNSELRHFKRRHNISRQVIRNQPLDIDEYDIGRVIAKKKEMGIEKFRHMEL